MGAPICDVFKFFFTAICLQNEHICNFIALRARRAGGEAATLSLQLSPRALRLLGSRTFRTRPAHAEQLRSPA